MIFSGIITTTLGKTATFTMGAGRERRVHHSKSLPLLSIGERLFFDLDLVVCGVANAAKKYREIMNLNCKFPLTSVPATTPDGGCPPLRRVTPDARAAGAS
jgi:hypothetical protein